MEPGFERVHARPSRRNRVSYFASTAYLSKISFQKPEYLSVSAWRGHAPFAFWLINALLPGRVVELGTHWGFSYFVFCQAVKELGLNTSCHAVDTWQGDEHAGFYSEDVYDQVSQHNSREYSPFSSLIRSTFQTACHLFEDGSIDLLHIDGRHYFDDVKADFEAWEAKLSDRSVVLFHDTNVHDR